MGGTTAALPQIQAGRPVILVMGRTPHLGRVKTRLARTLGRRAALRLHQAFLRDTLHLAQSAARTMGGHAVMAYAGPAPSAEHNLPAVHSFQQCCGDLGRRQTHAQDLLFRLSAGAVITIGSDSPTLPANRILSAWQDRSSADLLVVPAADGGYALLSHTRPLPDIYREVPWGTSRALAALSTRATSGRLTLRRMEPWYDIDDNADLQRLRQELAIDPGRAPCTAEALDALSLGPDA